MTWQQPATCVWPAAVVLVDLFQSHFEGRVLRRESFRHRPHGYRAHKQFAVNIRSGNPDLLQIAPSFMTLKNDTALCLDDLPQFRANHNDQSLVCLDIAKG